MILVPIAIGIAGGALLKHLHDQGAAATATTPTTPFPPTNPIAPPIIVQAPPTPAPPPPSNTEAAAQQAQGLTADGAIDSVAALATGATLTIGAKLPVVGPIIGAVGNIVNALPVPDVVKSALINPVIAVNATIAKGAIAVGGAVVDAVSAVLTQGGDTPANQAHTQAVLATLGSTPAAQKAAQATEARKVVAPPAVRKVAQ